MNYTAHQQEAIEARGEDLLISAAAGSGKTRVLVDRIVHMMVHDRVPLAEMLIVTFTNAAAGEMRARLRQGLQDAVAAAADEEAKAFLIAQLEDCQMRIFLRCMRSAFLSCAGFIMCWRWIQILKFCLKPPPRFFARMRWKKRWMPPMPKAMRSF